MSDSSTLPVGWAQAVNAHNGFVSRNVPHVSVGGIRSFWVAFAAASNPSVICHTFLDYANEHVMPMADYCHDVPPPEAVPENPNDPDGGDYRWTGWFHEPGPAEDGTYARFTGGTVLGWFEPPLLTASQKERLAALHSGALVLGRACNNPEAGDFYEKPNELKLTVTTVDKGFDAVEVLVSRPGMPASRDVLTLAQWARLASHSMSKGAVFTAAHLLAKVA